MLSNGLTIVIRTMAVLGIGVSLLACQPAEPPEDPHPAEPPAELTDTADLRPPLVVYLPRNADWDRPIRISAPRVEMDLSVRAPSLQPLPAPDMAGDDGDISPNTDTAVASFELPRASDKSPLSVKQLLMRNGTPGTLVQANWGAGETLHGAQIPTPVLVATGSQPGATLCITAAIHGDELNGIESVRRVMYSLDPTKLSGTVVGVPIVNLQGFQRHSRYLSDRRDLNRFFPGNPQGSSASRMAHSLFADVISFCDGLVDLHTGSFHRTNLPQLRADLTNDEVVELTKGFGATVILHSTGGEGTLRRAAVNAGIPAVTLEAGEPLRLQQPAVDHTVKAIFTLLDTMGMYDKRSLWGNPEPTYYSSAWVRADQGGILLSEVKLGRRVKQGELLGTITDPISNEQAPIRAPYTGRVIGMALNQFVMPGYATFHLATEAPIDEAGVDEHYHAEGMDIAVSDSMGGDESE